MKFATLLAAATTATMASARIIGIAAPETIKAGEAFTAKILTENYIQSVADVAIAFGVAPNAGYPGALGNLAGEFFLGPGEFQSMTDVAGRG